MTIINYIMGETRTIGIQEHGWWRVIGCRLAN